MFLIPAPSLQIQWLNAVHTQHWLLFSPSVIYDNTVHGFSTCWEKQSTMGPECLHIQTAVPNRPLTLSSFCSWSYRQLNRSRWPYLNYYVTAYSLGNRTYLLAACYKRCRALALWFLSRGATHCVWSHLLGPVGFGNRETSATILMLLLLLCCNKLSCSDSLSHYLLSALTNFWQANLIACLVISFGILLLHVIFYRVKYLPWN